MDKRNAMRAGAVTAAATLMMLMSSPAMAFVRDDGDDPGTGLSVGQTLGLYVALPIVSFLVIAGLCMIPGKKK
ncbi:photosystem II reaction center protein PsbW [Kitasatospora sp. NPDC059646]|uniref:photosystem II reaction center protein PsbW n=1 Tax=Kitasatospora sp. NPDC059646 TaxID=3346893 RepID=UPI00368A1B99